MPRLWLPILGVFLIFISVIARLGQLQLFLHSRLTSKTAQELTQKKRVRPLRGRVFDRQERLLAVSIERPSIFVSLKELDISRDSLARRLRVLVPALNFAETESRLRKGSGFLWLKRLAELEDGERVKKAKIRGLDSTAEGLRLYPLDPVAQALIGRVGLDGTGTSGLEHTLDPLLNGAEELRVVLRDALGKIFAEHQVPLTGLRREAKTSEGPFDIYLTLDMRLQSLAEKHLEDTLELYGAKKAMVALENISTGEFLVLASRGVRGAEPSGTLDPNFSVSLTFEPGSVLKPFVMAAALKKGVVRDDEKIDCENGKYRLTRDVEIEDHEPRGILSLNEVIAYSSNIGMAKIGLRLGPQNLYTSLRSWGFGTKTGIPVTGEATGLLKGPDGWSKTSLPMISFGQEIGLTTLQLVNAFSALASEGSFLEPQIIKEIRGARAPQALYESKPRRIRRVLSPSVCRKALAMMEEAVAYGTGVKAQIPGYRVAGKTGTAQKVDPATARYSEKRVVVSFCGVLPLPKPQFAICAVVDEPMKPRVAWASDIAAPLFKAVAEDAINILSLPPNADQKLN